MANLESLKPTLTDSLDGYSSVCLWFSGGSDSRLLLEILLEMQIGFAVIRLDEGWTREQKQQVNAVILKHNLQAFSYPAVNHLLVGEGDDISLVSTYSVDGKGNSVVLIRDVVNDAVPTKDIKLEKPRMPNAPIEFEVHIWGTRGDDRHYIAGDKPLMEYCKEQIGDKRFVYPLCDWNREEVTAELLRRGIDLSTDLDLDIHASHESLREYDFNPSANLELVRTALAV